MYIKRKIDTFLAQWKVSKDKKCLIIKGARQIGKTESIKHFAESYDNFIYINFVEEPKYKSIIQEGYKVEEIIKAISRIDPSKKFIKKKTLICFDEIQDCPEISTCLKFFTIDKNYDVICSGSLLGINYKKIESISVGYKIDYEMSSIDFEEFLWAKGYPKNISDDFLDNMIKVKPLSQLEFNTFNDLFIEYSILGGMPAIIKNYLKNKTYENTLEMQRQIVLDYKEDIRKYATGLEQTKLMNVYNQIVPQLGKENKKFQISKIKNARFSTYQGCIEWLVDSGIINICYCLNHPSLPLKANYNNSKFKLYYFDTGLLISQLDDETQLDLRTNKNLGIYKGAIYENMIAESFRKQNLDLFYYLKDNSSLEEDFFLRDRNGIVPIEVKASNNKSKSLSTLIESNAYPDIKYGIKLSYSNIGFNGKHYTFPYFLSYLIKRFLKQK